MTDPEATGADAPGPDVTSQAPLVSVVVPTRDRPDRLAVCLAALEAQRAPHLEIVVVDDASRDTRAVVGVVAGAGRARLVRGAGRGPAAARNAGVRAARAPVTCFTDDDCEPAPGWAEALASAIAGGAQAAASQAIATHLAEATIDPATGRMRFAPTSNLACRTEVCRSIPFDERYPLAAGEDRDWCARLTGSGHALVFEPSALVRHHQVLSPAGFWRQQLRYGRGGYRFHSDRYGTPLHLEAPRFYAGLLRRGFAEGPRAGVLVGVAQVATACGLVLEAAAARRAVR